MGFADRFKDKEKLRDLKPADVGYGRGLGVTKRILERAEKKYEKAVEKSMEHSEQAGIEAKEKFQKAIDETTAAIEAEIKNKNIVLDPSQMVALRGVLNNKVSCLIGPAGSGKTTLERIIIRHLVNTMNALVIRPPNEDGEENEAEENEKSAGIAVAAYTGRASQQSRKAIGDEFNIPISTMHSLLGYAPTTIEVDAYDEISRTYYKKEKRVFRPTFGLALKLPYQTYIIDEASMMPIPLFNEFIDAIHPTSRIILVGDIHQLPPVYGKSVFGYAMQKWPTFELAKIHRQAENSPIIANAHRILQGHPLQKASNFHLLPSKATSGTEFAQYARQVAKLLWEKKKFDPFRDVVIVANSNEDIPTSAPAMNDYFMTMFNGEKTVDGVIVNKRMHIHTGTTDVYFAIGDKVMINQNINTVNPPITNGMMGIVENINFNGRYDQKRSQVDSPTADDEDVVPFSFDEQTFANIAKVEEKAEKDDESMDQRQASHVMTIKFETGQEFSCSTSGDYRKISFGYAITCHKSQGGEYPNIIIAIHSANGALLTQEWLYTAVTRARNNVYLLYNEKGLQRALKVQKIKGKTLAEKIKTYVLETHSDDMEMQGNPWNVDRTKFPILFNPEEMIP